MIIRLLWPGGSHEHAGTQEERERNFSDAQLEVILGEGELSKIFRLLLLVVVWQAQVTQRKEETDADNSLSSVGYM